MLYMYVTIILCLLFPLIFGSSPISLLPCVIGASISLDYSVRAVRKRLKSSEVLLASTVFGASVGVGTAVIMYAGYIVSIGVLVPLSRDIVMYFSASYGIVVLASMPFVKKKLLYLVFPSAIISFLAFPIGEFIGIAFLYILLILSSILLIISGYILYPVQKKLGVFYCYLGALVCFLTPPIVYLFDIYLTTPSIISVKPPACHASPHGNLTRKEKYLHRIRRRMI